jgi:nickel transport protein
MIRKTLPLLALLLLAIFSIAGLAAAHGVTIDYTIAMTVQLTGTFDSGEPMANAQVTVYAPDDPADPWLVGEADENGAFSFVPDPDMPGTWDVQMRTAGHGDMVHIPIGTDGALSASTGMTPGQIILMSASVIWGFVGTALYFSARRRTTTSSEKDS